MSDRLTHLDAAGHAHMVEVGQKTPTHREAVAEGWVTLTPAVYDALVVGGLPKGDAFGVARIAGILGAKATSALIPLCHPLPLTGVQVTLIPVAPDRVRVEASVRCHGPTGVEMEALTAVSTACLALYDMCKALDKGLIIGPIRLLSKSGGKSGDYTAP